MAELSGTYSPLPSSSAPNLVGVFLRSKREALGLSQRSLGLLFEPSVTTQFISNIERGVTPLPPVHIRTLVRALKVEETEILQVLEREYAAKITHRFGHGENQPIEIHRLNAAISSADATYFQAIFQALQAADPGTRDAFGSLCETLLKVPKPNLPKTRIDG
ncbi:MAG: helix-turn-helix domain-containing protein [Cryobacterium sp.]|nr:helix-turn-helix domain-containing protein [Oligoflexia bacterium]